jgi:DNA-binding GntR family transcriptional regulator
MKAVSTNRESLNDRVYESIRDAIILGELAPGSLHSVYELAKILEVSRTPVREALVRLADQGMVRIERNRGARILQTSAHDLEEIYSIRLMLEVPATFRATQLITAGEVRRLRQALDALRDVTDITNPREHLEQDAQFHRVIMRASGNRRLADYIDSLRDLQMIRGASTAGKSRELAEIYRDHELIFERVESRDAKGAALAMRDHIAITSRLLLAQETGEADGGRFDPPWLDVLSTLA